MAGYPSNLAKKFPPTEQFPQHILPLLPLFNAQWWGYESLSAIVLGLRIFSTNVPMSTSIMEGPISEWILNLMIGLFTIKLH